MTPDPAAPPGAASRLVVAAAIVDDVAAPRAVLAARRSAPSELAGMWELPGGKVEPQEEPAAALHREIEEELGVRLRLGDLLTGPLAGDWPINARLHLRVWLATVASGTPAALLDHDELRWVGARAAATLPWLPADRPVLDALGLRA